VLSGVGMLGDGITHGASVSANQHSLDHPSIGTTSSSQLISKMIIEQVGELTMG